MSIIKTLGASALAIACAFAPRASFAGTFTTLYGFTAGNGATGCQPGGDLYYFNGTIYGAATYCGAGEGWGTIWQLALATNVVTAFFTYNYSNNNGADGVWPTTVSGYEDKLFAVAPYGGKGEGAIKVFNLNTGKALFKHEFPSTNIDGESPLAATETEGAIYGVTQSGGTYGAGVLYSIDPTTKAQTILHQFSGGADGGTPSLWGALVKADGVIYGTTTTGGAYGFGTLFKYDIASGSESVLYDFNPVRSKSFGGLTYGGGKLWGVTSGLYGTVFSIDPKTGDETDVYYFTDGADGGASGPLTYYNGLLYGEGTGTAPYGQTPLGDIFRIDPVAHKETTLYQFTGGTDGSSPAGQLLERDGSSYGVTSVGGANNGGTIFKFTP